MDEKQRPIYPSPPYSGPLHELAPPEGEGVRVRFACPHCGKVLERLAKLDETRWYLPGCSFEHSGVGIHDPSIRRIPFDPAKR
jgi:predicted RNA-binding Zn-ribbon protein involved in translation (DUF1610 family)